MPGAGEQEEPDIEVDKENGNPQASGAKDVVENLREMAQDLIETKLLFDTELKLALEKEPANIGLLDIQQLINDVFGQQKTSNIPRNSSPDTVLEDDFELRREEVQQIDLIHFVQSAKSTVKTTTLFGEDDKKDEYPSFSLGIDEDINGNQAEQAAMIEEAVPVEENVPIPATEITPKPALREKSTRALKMGRYGKSPFLERVIDISSKITNQEFGIWRFMIPNKNPIEQLFVFNDYYCIREDMQTLRIGKNLATSVVDTWALILNDAEKFKSDDSPLRLFCTIGCVQPTLDANTYQLFADNMDDMLIQFNRTRLDIVEMVFFPICAFEHFYLIFYNIKNAAYEIIDNIDREIDAQICYGDKPRMLHFHFTDYLESKGLINIARRLRRLTPTFTKMTWQTTRNSIDCGIFLMRHMESYMGDARTWSTDLNAEQHGQENQLIKLRIKYNNAILSSQLNQKRKQILKEGKELYIESASRKLVNLVIHSSQSSQEESQSKKRRGQVENKKKVRFARNLSTTFEEADTEMDEV
ncbi:uncharacterized protein LOC108202422 [Daucus carota subsp. sativus]|uniref:uncharacterized protein LOC108202422 n=1 Tax=Daucus carota subsp. sativus TaxID=79200 RepID=UPI003083DBA4